MQDMNAFAELRKKIIETLSPGCREASDYPFPEKEKKHWELLASVGNSAIVVMDIYTGKPLYISECFFRILGIEGFIIQKDISEFLPAYIHPVDFPLLAQEKFSNFCFLLNLPAKHKTDYKEIFQYRIQTDRNKYIWVIEQQQVVMLDDYGNARITLSVVDVSPNQQKENKFESHIFNYKTGELLPAEQTDRDVLSALSLTEREKEILRMIQQGFLSKEISAKLSISFHTVNTHRQNILKKLNANNSLEAISYAEKMGFI